MNKHIISFIEKIIDMPFFNPFIEESIDESCGIKNCFKLGSFCFDNKDLCVHKDRFEIASQIYANEFLVN